MRTFAKNLQRIFNQEDQYIRSLYLSLMQTEYRLGGLRLSAEYRMISPTRLMLIFTDITQQRELEKLMADERNRLAFIVSAVRDTREFFEVLESFQSFTETTLPGLLHRSDELDQALGELYRRVHTFKGLFSQLDFIHLPSVLHDLESRLRQSSGNQESDVPAGETVTWPGTDLEEALGQDKAILSDTLGGDFFERRGYVTLTRDQVRRLKALAENRLGRGGTLPLEDWERKLLEEIRHVGYVDFKALLGFHSKAVQNLARRQGKLVEPFSIEGDCVRVDPEIYGSVARSFLHVFRNAVDHGVESSEERELLGKPPAAQIRCRVERQDSLMSVYISDDGRGLSQEAIRERAVNMGLCTPDGESPSLKNNSPHSFSTSSSPPRRMPMRFRDAV